MPALRPTLILHCCKKLVADGPTVSPQNREEVTGQPLRLLIVEDSEDDADLLLRVLRPAGYEPAYEIVDTLPTMRTALEHKDWDIITSDHSMPQFSAPAALALAKGTTPQLPVHRSLRRKRP